MGVEEHRKQSEAAEEIRVAVVTVSDSRTAQTDESGPLAAKLLEAAGHRVVHRSLIPNDGTRIEALLFELLDGPADAVLFTGGTGLSARDRTLDTIAPHFEKRLDGFGELFRALSYAEIGTAAMLSRAAAGTVRGRFVVCLPGSAKAVELAVRRLILPELRHVVWQLR